MDNYSALFCTYLIFNIVLMIGYGLTRLVLFLAKRSFIISQKQQVQIVKVSLLSLVIAFIGFPILFSQFQPVAVSSFQIEPFLKESATNLLLNKTFESEYAFPVLKSGNAIIKPLLLLLLMLGGGIGYSLFRYVSSLRKLSMLAKNSFIMKQQGNITLLVNEDITIPLCWSFLNKSYVCISQECLQDVSLMKTYLMHEIQHVRQRDPLWQHILGILNALCFWNPATIVWGNLLVVSQEYACDEALVIKGKISAVSYTKALLNAAESLMKTEKKPVPQWGSMHFFSHEMISVLKIRTSNLFAYNKILTSKKILASIGIVFVLCFALLSYTLNAEIKPTVVTLSQLKGFIEKNNLDKSVDMSANEEILFALNNMLASPKTVQFIYSGLNNRKQYQSLIGPMIVENQLPKELMALPLAESGYHNLKNNKALHTAGIWQFVPKTAKSLGLKIDKNTDERLNPEQSSKAALTLLKSLHEQFGNWQLAFAAYHQGDKRIGDLIQKYQSRDIWELTQRESDLDLLQRYLAIVNAVIIIMVEPGLVNHG